MRSIFLALILSLISAPVYATSVTNTQDIPTILIINQPINVQQCTPQITTSMWRALAFNISYVTVPGAAATAILMTCTGYTGYGYAAKIQVITSTTATGVSSTVTSTWSHTVTPAIDETWSWTVANIVWPYVTCCFTATGANANDFLAVYGWGVTP